MFEIKIYGCHGAQLVRKLVVADFMSANTNQKRNLKIATTLKNLFSDRLATLTSLVNALMFSGNIINDKKTIPAFPRTATFRINSKKYYFAKKKI